MLPIERRLEKNVEVFSTWIATFLSIDESGFPFDTVAGMFSRSTSAEHTDSSAPYVLSV